MVTVVVSTGIKPSLLSNCTITLAILDLSSPDFSDPWKISLAEFSALSLRVDSSPSAKSSESIMFDLPLPLGPVIAVKPLSKFTLTVCGPKDLKPFSSMRLMYGT